MLMQEEVFLKLQKAECSVIVNFIIPIDSCVIAYKSRVTPGFLEGRELKISSKLQNIK